MARTTQPTAFRYRDDTAMRAALLLGLAAMLFFASLVTAGWSVVGLAVNLTIIYALLAYGPKR